MNARQFFDKVAEMRRLQKEYFRTRSARTLQLSKAIEREVDAEIKRVQDIANPPRDLFSQQQYNNNVITKQ